MLLASLAWRRENRIDGIFDREGEVPEKYKITNPTGYFGDDKDGNSIVCLPLGRYKNRDTMAEIGLPAFLRLYFAWMEIVTKLLKEREAETGKKGLQVIQLVDMECYSIREIMYQPVREFVKVSQAIVSANYPESLKVMLIINAPSVFALAFKLVRHLMPKETLAKIDIYGQDEEEWKRVLRSKCAHLNKVPVRWGGTLKSTDIFGTAGTEASVWSGIVPLSFFTDDVIDSHGFKKVKVGARDKYKMDVFTTSSRSEIRWRFNTEDHDIGFQVVCPRGSTLVPWRRLDSHNSMQEGTITCETVGKYQLVFDNSFSYTKAKMVKYYVQVVEDGDDENEDLHNVDLIDTEYHQCLSRSFSFPMHGDVVS
ncbi:retinal-binding protein [Folsomia candida]|uniref:retinal-binding protein n=1 Tax=Folsomia candida TaxID=158441 RepID=UPI000B8EF8C0|nr:retinal-binding protein [Folsomia candida]